jgi:GTP-binding protein
MIGADRTVALVGRPNVGKSRLFNRLAGKRLSIVHDQPGVTRDLVAAEVDNDFLLLDTGGIGMELAKTPQAIARAADEQVDYALSTARIILMVVDCREGLTALDEWVAERLRPYGKAVRLVVNKADNPGDEELVSEFAALGLGEPIAVSAEHGRGTDGLLATIRSELGPPPEAVTDEAAADAPIRFALMGRPNVGKSSLGNALLHSQRLIVSDVPGTTRDSVELAFDYERRDGSRQSFLLTDTAGLRLRGKVDTSVEYFSAVRTRDAMDRADVVFLVIDAIDGVTKQDQSLAGDALDRGKALVIVVNKWDLVKERVSSAPPAGFTSLKAFQEQYEEALRQRFFFLPESPVLFVSALSGFKVEQLLESAISINQTLDMKLPTGPLNRLLEHCLEERPPKIIETKRFKVYYSVQVGSRPFRLKLFCNRVTRLDPSYRRYLERAVIENFRLRGCPIRIELVGKDRRYAEPESVTGPVPNWSPEQTRRVKKERKQAEAIKKGKQPYKKPLKASRKGGRKG